MWVGWLGRVHMWCERFCVGGLVNLTFWLKLTSPSTFGVFHGPRQRGLGCLEAAGGWVPPSPPSGSGPGPDPGGTARAAGGSWSLGGPYPPGCCPLPPVRWATVFAVRRVDLRLLRRVPAAGRATRSLHSVWPGPPFVQILHCGWKGLQWGSPRRRRGWRVPGGDGVPRWDGHLRHPGPTTPVPNGEPPPQCRRNLQHRPTHGVRCVRTAAWRGSCCWSLRTSLMMWCWPSRSLASRRRPISGIYGRRLKPVSKNWNSGLVATYLARRPWSWLWLGRMPGESLSAMWSP